MAWEARHPPAWIFVAGVVLVEYLILSWRFDGHDLLRAADLTWAFGKLGSVGPLGFLVAAAVLITGGHTTKEALEHLAPASRDTRGMVALGGLHLGIYGAVFLLARHIAQMEQARVLAARGWLTVWISLVGFSLVSVVLVPWRGQTLRSALRLVRSRWALGLVVGLAAWVLGLLAQGLWEPLAWLTLECVHALLTIVVFDPVASVEHSLVGTRRFYVHIAPACSGVEGIGLMLAFLGGYFYVERQRLRWPRALILLPITALGIWLLNILRIAALVAVGTWFSPAIAEGGFHSKAGWLLFTLVTLGTVLFVKKTALFQRADPSSTLSTTVGARGAPQEVVHRADAAYLLPLLSVLAVTLICGLFTSNFDFFYPLRVMVALVVLSYYRREYPKFTWSSLGWGIVVGLGVFAVWVLGFQMPEAGSQSRLGENLAALPRVHAVVWLAFRFVGTTVTVPIIEELAFRGYLMRRISARDFEQLPLAQSSWLGLIVASLAFGALHSQWALGIVAGLAFGGLARARGRLGDAVVAHAVANGSLFIYSVASQKWDYLA